MKNQIESETERAEKAITEIDRAITSALVGISFTPEQLEHLRQIFQQEANMLALLLEHTTTSVRDSAPAA